MDILNKIAGEYGRDIQFNTSGSPPPQLEYTVQHRETDLNFIMRTLEAYGMSFHFEHNDGNHKMIATNGPREALPSGAGRSFRPAEQYGHDEEIVHTWLPQRHFTTAHVKVEDYNFKQPSAEQKQEKTASVEFNPKLEHYAQLYNVHMEEKETNWGSQGSVFAQAILDMHRSEDKRSIAVGDAVGMTPGYTMQLTNHDDFAGKYLVLRCVHEYTAQYYRSNGTEEPPRYEGVYETMPDEQRYVPPMITPRPLIPGIQTGTVKGSKDIDVDEWGRIPVKMHWNTGDETTLPCRVLQSLAGKEWGAIFTPRLGMEVMVQYVDGDPERPFVIGCVYNDEYKPPYALPGDDNKNISGWKTRSTEGGGTDDYNEFVFDDTKSKEKVRLHAQKDLESTIENDEKRTIQKGNRTTTIEQGNDTLTVQQDILVEAKKSITLKVGKNTIVMDMMGITVNGVKIQVDAETTLNTKAKIMAAHESDGVLTVKGSMVMIN
jgi:type VI secretion system secreted protein VgrG